MSEDHCFGSGLIQGRVDYLSSHETGFERIYVLSKIYIRTVNKTEPYSLSDKEVAMIADMFATIMQRRVDRDHEFPTFVIYDVDAGPWTTGRRGRIR